MAKTVNKQHYKACLLKLRDLRLWAVQGDIDPWAFRQMLLIALEMDTKAALERGVKSIDLLNFDSIVKKNIQLWMLNL